MCQPQGMLMATSSLILLRLLFGATCLASACAYTRNVYLVPKVGSETNFIAGIPFACPALLCPLKMVRARR